MGYVIGISHKASDPRRVESLARLRNSVDWQFPDFVEDTPGHHSVWAPRMWQRALNTSIEHCVFLQDDVILHHINFRPYCLDEIVCLHTPHTKFIDAWHLGYDWATSVDGLVGNGYIFPRHVLEEFLTFRSEVMYPEVLEELNEDAQINLFAMATDRRISHPLPSPIDHDTSIPSTWGADNHPNRKPCAPWNAVRAVGVRMNGAYDVGRIYPREHWRLLTHLRSGRHVERAYRLAKL